MALRNITSLKNLVERRENILKPIPPSISLPITPRKVGFAVIVVRKDISRKSVGMIARNRWKKYIFHTRKKRIKLIG